jgi:hypothetical protein
MVPCIKLVLDMVIKIKVILFAFVGIVSSVSYSQSWQLTFKPYFGGVSLCTQRSGKVVMDDNIVYANGYKPTSYSIFDNLCLSSSYSLGFLSDIYQLKNKWTLGVGLNVYTSSQAFYKLKAIGGNYDLFNVYVVSDKDIVYGNSKYLRFVETGPVDFQLLAMCSKEMNIRVNNRENTIHSIGIGAGCTNMKASDDMEVYSEIDKYTYKKYTNHKIHPFLLLRYEVLLRNKKQRNLFSVALSYQQGIFKVGHIEVEDVYNYWAFKSQGYVSRGSSFYLSVSRPFVIIPPKQNKI